MIHRNTMYVALLLLLCGTPSAHAATSKTIARQLTPAFIGAPVMVTQFAKLHTQAFTVWEWQEIIIPSSLADHGFRFEIWDEHNVPLRQIPADVITATSIDLRALDASVNPMIRIVIFAPDPTKTFPADARVRFVAQRHFNTRLLVLSMLAGIIVLIILILTIAHRIGIVDIQKNAARILHDKPPAPTIRSATTSALLIILASSVFAITLALQQEWHHTLFVLIKLPFLLLGSLLMSVTSLYVLGLLMGLRTRFLAMFTASLSSIATSSVVLAAFAPIMVLEHIMTRLHDPLLLAAFGLFVIAMTAGLLPIGRFLVAAKGWKTGLAILLLWGSAYGIILLQWGWMLRPWIGSPDPVTGLVPFSRLYGGNVFVELWNTFARL